VTEIENRTNQSRARNSSLCHCRSGRSTELQRPTWDGNRNRNGRSRPEQSRAKLLFQAGSTTNSNTWTQKPDLRTGERKLKTKSQQRVDIEQRRPKIIDKSVALRPLPALRPAPNRKRSRPANRQGTWAAPYLRQ
jgi:hypothetical protein